MGSNTSSISFELNGESFYHDLQLYGSIEDVQKFKTYGSDVDNAAIVVNKVLIYGIRLIFVDGRTNRLVVRKLCDQPTKKDAKKAMQILKNGLQSEYGIKCLSKIYKSDNIHVGGTLCVQSRKLEDFCLTELIWWTEPLKNAASVVGGKHSKIEAMFEHNLANLHVNVVVERMQNGIFLAPLNGCKERECYASASAKDENAKHFGVNLEQFLSDCNAENEGFPYQLDSNDCHCFAQELWRRCVPTRVPQKPNIILTKIGSGVFNNFLPSASSGVQCQTVIQSVKPNHEDDAGVLQQLGMSAEDAYVKQYERKCKYPKHRLVGCRSVCVSGLLSFMIVSMPTRALFGMLPETKSNMRGCAELTYFSLCFM